MQSRRLLVGGIALAGLLAGGATAGPGQSPPVNVSPPTIGGSTVVGQTLTADPGSWNGGPSTTYAFQWNRCAGGCASIGGATASSYTLTSADAGSTISVAVVASNKNGSTSVNSSPTSAVTEPTHANATTSSTTSTTTPTSTGTATSSTTTTTTRPTTTTTQASTSTTTKSTTTTTQASTTTTTQASTTTTTKTTTQSSTPPTNASLPAISGVPQQGETLIASPGSWNGTAPIGYAYSWRRCDTSGASCASISGANSTSYALQSADVGSTIRVSVAASNSAGSTSATSGATAVVAGQVTSFNAADFTELLDNPFSILTAPYNNPFWVVNTASGSQSWVSDGAVGGAMRLTSNGVGQAGSDWGQQQSVVVGSRPLMDPVHGGRVPGTGADCCDGNGQPEDTWYTWRMRFPAGYKATQGTQNYGFEFHVDDKTAADAQRFGNSVGSTVVDVMSDYPVTCTGSPNYCTTPGVNPRLFLQVTGGRTSDPASTTIKRYFPFAANSLLLDHWYDMVLHIYWSPDPSVGHVEWWVDGVKVVDVYTSTEYVRSDGTYSYAEDMAMENYRLWASWPSSIDYDQVVWGASASSIGFTP